MTRPQDKLSPLAAASAPSHKSVLPPYLAILDDNKSVGRALSRLLRPLGMPVRAFSSSAEFFEAVGQRQPECVLLDVQMPEMSGLEVQERLLTQGSRVPIIFITANDDAAIRAQALARGAKGFISKPFEERALLDLIAAARGLPVKTPGSGLRLQSSLKLASSPGTGRDSVVDFQLTDLLPCPFCGAYPRLSNGTWVDEKNRNRYWARIICPRCDAGVRPANEAQAFDLKSVTAEAVLRWNQRVSPNLPAPAAGGKPAPRLSQRLRGWWRRRS